MLSTVYVTLPAYSTPDGTGRTAEGWTRRVTKRGNGPQKTFTAPGVHYGTGSVCGLVRLDQVGIWQRLHLSNRPCVTGTAERKGFRSSLPYRESPEIRGERFDILPSHCCQEIFIKKFSRRLAPLAGTDLRISGKGMQGVGMSGKAFRSSPSPFSRILFHSPGQDRAPAGQSSAYRE